MGISEEGGKVATSVVDAMKGTPMLMVVLLINAAFLGSLVYLMGVATSNAGERNKQQLALIKKLAFARLLPAKESKVSTRPRNL